MKRWLYDTIFEADTFAGKAFDVGLIFCILLSVGIVILDSVASLNAAYGTLFYQLEWGFTLIFTIEYILRLWLVDRPSRYSLSFFGIVDLISILPTYLSLFFPGGQALLVIRLLRVLRIFRVLKLVQYVRESRILMESLKESARKIFVFLLAVVILVIILGSIIFLVEGAENGFTSIPRSIYWAIVTLTTVGYGDIAPQTELGQVLAAFVMLMGYGIIAVPAGIVSSELSQGYANAAPVRKCPNCGAMESDARAAFCKFCSTPLP